MENPNKTPVPDDWQPFQEEAEKKLPTKCPHCQKGSVVHDHEHFDVNKGWWVWDCSCTSCDEKWAEDQA